MAPARAVVRESEGGARVTRTLPRRHDSQRQRMCQPRQELNSLSKNAIGSGLWERQDDARWVTIMREIRDKCANSGELQFARNNLPPFSNATVVPKH